MTKIKANVIWNINNEDYEPPIKVISLEMLRYSFANQIVVYYIPIIISMGTVFSLFGKKLIVIFMFGAFLLVLLVCYKNLLKSEMLIDLKWHYKGF